MKISNHLSIKLLLFLPVLATLLVMLTGCSTTPSIKTNFEVNPAVNTANYKTFSWLTKDHLLVPSSTLSPITKLKISQAIETELISKGYTLVNSKENADFTVSFTVGSRDKIKVSSYPATYQSFGWGRRFYGGYHTMGMTTQTQVRSYTEGKLAIDIYDEHSKQPAWHGWASKRLTSKDAKNKDVLIKQAVVQLLMTFK